MSTITSDHVWKFFRTGGLDQASLETAADLLNLQNLDQKLWVALSCPVKGLEIDERTLKLIDSDGDGRIRVPELLAAIAWGAARLRDPADLLRGTDTLALASVDESKEEGALLLASARRVLRLLGKADAEVITLADTVSKAEILGTARFNGDGVIGPASTDNAEVTAVIAEIIAAYGGEKDLGGEVGVNQAQVEAFFADAAAHLEWLRAGAEPGVVVLGSGTGAALAAVRAVRAKVEDYFTRTRLATFDGRALEALNRPEGDYAAWVHKDLSSSDEQIKALPLARVEPGRPLPLLEGVNPAWKDALAALYRDAVTPLFGAEKSSLTEGEWARLQGHLAAYEAWEGAPTGTAVASLGAERLDAILAGPTKAALEALLERDRAVAAEFDAIVEIERLVRYQRDLRTLLHNFVNFADFYSHDRYASFQAGTLYLDSRSCELCIKVDDPGAHSALAGLSKIYIAYCECRRVGQAPMKIAACFTQGDSDYLMVGRNGIFYDRQGADWDATIVKIIENPISLRQAFWSPYKKFVRMIEEQVAKRAAAAEEASTAKLEQTAGAVATADKAAPPAPKKFDVGTVAALGVGVGAIGTFLATILAKVIELKSWQYPLVILGIILLISSPAVIIAWLKLRQRTLGPVLDANGWAINGRVKINIPFGTALTDRAELPPNSRRLLEDPYEDKAAKRRRRLLVLLVILLAAGGYAFWAHRNQAWPFPPPIETAPAETPAPAEPPAN